MPRIAPPGGVVDWPESEGTLGVVGVAPWATLDFCRVLYQAVRASKDWHFPRLLLDINTKIPSRGRHLQLGETDPSSAIAATIAELAEMGVGRVSIPVASCMVAHKALTDFFKALKASPTGTLPGETKWVTSFAEYTQAVGLPEYRALEEKYLPKERFETKYQNLAKLGA